MSILCDVDLLYMVDHGLITPANYDHINPASIDICIGKTMQIEQAGRFVSVDIPPEGVSFQPGDFALVATMETFNVPNGYAMDLRLKSSTARRGFDHSLAFWVDPGWQGVLTMEIRNVLQFNALKIVPGQRFAQVVVHKLSGLSARPYRGRYHGAAEVEGAKD